MNARAYRAHVLDKMQWVYVQIIQDTLIVDVMIPIHGNVVVLGVHQFLPIPLLAYHPIK